MPDEALESLDREKRLDEAVTAFLEAQEAGRRPHRAEWLERYPEVAAELNLFFADQDEVDRLTSPLRAVLQGTPPPDETPQPGQPGGASAPVTPSALATPPEGYELLQVLGHGGMGLVYKARQKNADRLVALKLIRTDRLTSDADVQRFRNEAEAAAQLDHPHIVPVYEVGARPGHFFFSMKLIEGGGLDEQLDRFRDDPHGAARLLARVARAVQHAHQRGILHRDLKPSNILLDREGQPHVSDFGLAKRIEADSSLTQTGAILGTPQYMAPEQTRSQKGAVTTATDVNGLGTVLYALLTRRPPFQCETVLETLEHVREHEPEPPRRINAKVDRDLETICLKCLEKEPGQRYGSAETLAEELESWLRGEPIQARRIGWLQRLWRWCRRNPALAFVSGLAIAALLSTTVVSLMFAFRETQNAQNLGDALKDLGVALATSETNRRHAERRLAENYLDQGLNLCEQGEIGLGLHWLVRALETLPEDQADLEWVIRVNLAGWTSKLHVLKAILEHQGPVLTVAYSPDGQTILTGSEDGTVRFWEAATGKHLDRNITHPGGVRALAISPDGRTLVTVSSKPQKRFGEEGGYTNAINRAIAGGTIRFWETATGKPKGLPLSEWSRSRTVAFSPDGQTLATGDWDHNVRLRQADSGKLLCPPLPHPNEVWAIAFSPNGRKVATAGLSPGVRLWETATGRPSSPALLRELAATFAVAWSPDGQRLVTGGHYDGLARIWDAVSAKERGFLLQHRQHVVAAAFSRDGRTILTGSYDQRARLWDAQTGKSIGQPLAHQHLVQTVAISPDGTSFVTGSWDGTARLWKRSAAKSRDTRILHEDYVDRIAISPDDRMLMTSGPDNVTRLWDAVSGKLLWASPPLENHQSLAFNPTGELFAIGERVTGAIQIRAVDSGKLVCQFLHPHLEEALVFSSDGRFLLTGGDKAHLWDVCAGKATDRTLPHPGRVTAVSVSRDGQMLLTGGTDKTVRLWDAATGRPLGEALPHASIVRAIALSLDDRTILSATENGIIHRWDRDTGAPSGPPLQPHNPGWCAPRFSPDGRLVLLVFGDRVTQLTDLATGKCICLPLHSNLQGGHAIAFSQGSRSLVTIHPEDQLVSRWEVPSPITGEKDRILCWIELITGLELDRDGVMHVLDAPSWRQRQRQRRLEEMGGPP